MCLRPTDSTPRRVGGERMELHAPKDGWPVSVRSTRCTKRGCGAEHGFAKRRANLPLSSLRNIRTHVTRAHVRVLSHLECMRATKRMTAFVSRGPIGTWTLQGPGRPRPGVRGSGRESVPAGAGLQTRVWAGTAGVQKGKLESLGWEWGGWCWSPR